MKFHARARWSIELDKEDVDKLVQRYPANTEIISEDLVSIFADSEELTDLLCMVSEEEKLRKLCAGGLKWSWLYAWVEEDGEAYFDITPQDIRRMLDLGFSFSLTFDG